MRFMVPLAIACFLVGIGWGYVSAHLLALQ